MSLAERKRARGICAACPVRNDCLLEALVSDDRWGVWGGLTYPERKRAMELYSGSIAKVMRDYGQRRLEEKVIKR